MFFQNTFQSFRDFIDGGFPRNRFELPRTFGTNSTHRYEHSIRLFLPLRVLGHLGTGESLGDGVFAVAGKMGDLPILHGDIQCTGIWTV